MRHPLVNGTILNTRTSIIFARYVNRRNQIIYVCSIVNNMPTAVIEDHMLDWHKSQICYSLEIKLLLLLLLLLLSLLILFRTAQTRAEPCHANNLPSELFYPVRLKLACSVIEVSESQGLEFRILLLYYLDSEQHRR